MDCLDTRRVWPHAPSCRRACCLTAKSVSSNSPSRLATEPKLLLLDEPLGRHRTRRIRSAWSRPCERLKGRTTIVLIEHDMDAVFSLADRVSVLVYGRVIATDTPAQIRANPEVRAAYLGEEGWSDAVGATTLQASYGAAQVLFDVSLRRRRGRGRHPARPQRHGQDHDDPLHHGPASPARRRSARSMASAVTGRAPYRDRAGGDRPRAGGPADLPDPDGRGEPRRHRLARDTGRAAGRSTRSTICSRA